MKLPHVEKYANVLSWKEGTLEEPIGQEEMLRRETSKLEKEADLESCGQVSSSYQRQIGAATSSSTAQQQVAGVSQQETNKGKGKEVEQEQSPPRTQQQT